ncbi:site-specific integrase [Stieleria sp. JC731]|uniref:tyrosine-type recombinase/integrase n=1 Tax=Pirellulaceae TaxID=2691357 RepID=UPI001E30088F|nr:tyrosine-type recombinase/integrase [Stieleria sp. JC731]MCC9600386.1 site-specific integrase [Stieleria sp. JC731]
MASLRFENHNGRKGWRLQFRDSDKRNRSIWLGGDERHAPTETKEHVEHLIVQAKNRRPPELATSEWLATIDDELQSKLARCGLVEAKAKRIARTLTIAAWLKEYFAERKDVKSGTLQTYEKARDNLLDYFGKRCLLRDVTSTDANKWRTWLKTEGNRRDTKQKRKSMAEDTVRRRTGMAKQFFGEAVKRGLINVNPFDDLPTTTGGNKARQHFVDQSVIEDCMNHCDPDWQTILALARYGGMRCPSEVLRLRWIDVNLPEGRMVVHASKTEHHADGGVRVVPIFEELRPYLERAYATAPDGSEYVVANYRSAAANLRTQFTKIIKRAGHVPWPRLFQNLRASRETELMAKYPAKDVAAWLGNTVAVAMKHYAMQTEDAFRRAAGIKDPLPTDATTENGGCIGGCISGESDTIEREVRNDKTPVSLGKTGDLIVEDSSGNFYLVGDTGFEPVTSAV